MSGVKKRAKTLRLVTKGLQDLIQGGVQVVDVLRDDICQVPVLELIPDILHLIKIRRVWRKPFHLEPRSILLKEPD